MRPHEITRTVLLGFLSVLLTSCSINMYSPGTPNIPLTDTIGNGHFEFALSNDGLDVKTNIRVQGPFNASFAFGSHHSQPSMETSFGYCKTNSQYHYGFHAGYGFGNTEFREGDGDSFMDVYGNGRYHSLFLQALFGGGKENNKFGVVIKIAYMPYAITYFNHHMTPAFEMDRYYSGTGTEAGLYYRQFASSGMMFSFYLGVNSLSSSIPLYTQGLNSGVVMGIGLGFRFKDKKASGK